jgi:hypothetical protein
LVFAAEKEELPRALTLPVHSNHRRRKAESRMVTGPAAEALLTTMKSPAFVAYVEEVTGLVGLQTDDTNFWGGLHANGKGCFCSLHRDFEVHPVTNLWHRVNVLLYLNSDWREEYGGDLELWASDVKECGARIKPDAGTLVIFETHAGTLHGIPDPLSCPEDRMRLSLATYYYSEEPPPRLVHESRFRRARRPQDPWWVGVPDVFELARIVLDPVAEHVPPVRRGMNALRDRRS